MAVVAPAAATVARVVLRGLIFPFAVLAGYFVAWGMVFCMDAIVRAFFGTVSGAVAWIPFAGRVITAPLHGIEKKLTSFLGGLEAHFEHQMATRWHTLAQLVTQYAQEAVADAVAIQALVHKIAYVYGEAATGKLGARFQKWVAGELAKLHGVTTIVRPVKVIVEHPAVGKIGGAIRAGVKPLAALLAGVITIDLPRLRARDRYLTDQVGRLWRWTRTHARPVVAGVGLGALVYALGRLGMGWARCTNVRRVGRRICGMDHSLLDALLLDTLAIAGTLSLVAFAEEMQGVAETAVRPITTFWRAS